MVFSYKEIIKIDLDIQDKQEAIETINQRLSFLVKIGLFEWKYIKKVELLYKITYSCRIFINKSFTDKLDLIIFQSILGDDFKRTAITWRDYNLGMKDFNKLFTIKKYIDDTYITAEIIDITEIILSREIYE